MAEITLGDARACMMKQGKWPGRAQRDLADAMKQMMMQKEKSVAGTASTLAVSPVNGTRVPCNALEAKQSVLGDCQSKQGFAAPEAAKIKNEGALLGNENLFVESLLAAVSIGDEDIVQEVLSGATAPRTDSVWATGDNIYVTGMDMSWNNFHIGDLLVMPGAVVVNTGYPHFACWKYGVRAGDEPKAYINSPEGIALRMRGIKGAFLLPSACPTACSIRSGDPVRIVEKGSPEYKEVVQDCQPPLDNGAEIVYRMNGKEVRAAANDTQAYVDLLVEAGCDAARIDMKKYQRTLPDITMKALGVQTAQPVAKVVAPTMEISPAAMSGDGTLANVGVKMGGRFRCPECRQVFDSEKANQLHWKFIHDPNRHEED